MKCSAIQVGHYYKIVWDSAGIAFRCLRINFDFNKRLTNDMYVIGDQFSIFPNEFKFQTQKVIQLTKDHDVEEMPEKEFLKLTKLQDIFYKSVKSVLLSGDGSS